MSIVEVSLLPRIQSTPTYLLLIVVSPAIVHTVKQDTRNEFKTVLDSHNRDFNDTHNQSALVRYLDWLFLHFFRLISNGFCA